ncbi:MULTISPECIES: DUF3140 domain-containing protein [unclassified Streptomyces]|uniref:DUF3140 domain-containing protein n=1 Tax=unclassified Streptomyces TaxID=2593676 RepID=UPI000D149800
MTAPEGRDADRDERKAGLDDDLAHLREATGYVHRHVRQRPKGDVTDTRWRHSLVNRGRDPGK